MRTIPKRRVVSVTWGSDLITGPANRVIATVQNGVEVLRFGGLQTGSRPSPFQTVERCDMYRLRRYFPDSANDPSRPPVILVPPMMMSANVFDVTRDQGAVGVLHDLGVDPWVVDFGSPDRETGGLERTLSDHVVALSRVIDSVHAHTGRKVHLAGYSQGGMFCYQTAAYRRSEGLASVITFGSAVDSLSGLPFGIPAALAGRGAQLIADHVFNRLSVSGWMARTGFQLLDPIKTVRARWDFLRQLHDREALLPREQQRRFLEVEGWVAWSGPAVAELLRQFVVHNRMMAGGAVIDGTLITLAEITCPVLAFIGEVDDIGQPASVRGIRRAAPRAEVSEVLLRAGHFGLVVGSTAATQTWPTVGKWVLWQDGRGPRPEGVHAMEADPSVGIDGAVGLSSRIGHSAGALAELGIGVSLGLADAAVGAARSGREIAGEAARTLPRLARLGRLQPHTRVSLGGLMAEQANRAPEEECFLFEDRVHTNAAVDHRIDDAVRGLIAVGVRQGAHIGVLMDTSPSAVTAIAALSRLGAVAVLLPPDDDLAAAVQLCEVADIVTDPHHLAAAAATGARVLVLGHGRTADLCRTESDRVVELDRLDLSGARLPQWYRPNPGRASDLAFVFFSTTGGRRVVKEVSGACVESVELLRELRRLRECLPGKGRVRPGQVHGVGDEHVGPLLHVGLHGARRRLLDRVRRRRRARDVLGRHRLHDRQLRRRARPVLRRRVAAERAVLLRPLKGSGRQSPPASAVACASVTVWFTSGPRPQHPDGAAGGSITERTAASGRLLQPASRARGAVTRYGTAPFRMLQRGFPGTGTGLIVLARLAG